ncbi:hypothetical protein BDV27DRAFT_123413 [Aspergillus caelatus]|uniref:Uncharacterized protein n=1 Tax=Aspergillus caelatus TaxID=61420 RepID=A0A5N7AD41_9EURO|nr:uncharacterized protein BDV27DRAFT_123413 [Aspergillus caelatus]KAE8367784.1 hypothetical protein BDV27DRAFT_123413 [Aspergillus caelatus]
MFGITTMVLTRLNGSRMSQSSHSPAWLKISVGCSQLLLTYCILSWLCSHLMTLDHAALPVFVSLIWVEYRLYRKPTSSITGIDVLLIHSEYPPTRGRWTMIPHCQYGFHQRPLTRDLVGQSPRHSTTVPI